jgi:class 3 adenylate cyclase
MHRNRLILIADGDPHVRDLSCQILRDEGYAVVGVDTGAKTVEAATSQPIAAFLLDAKLQDMTGLELCRSLRRLPQHHATPILFVTEQDTYEALSSAFGAGCDDFIRKPINPIELQVRIEEHLTRTDHFQQLERTRRMLNRYLSRRTAEVVETVARTGVLPPPEERQLTILFTDIRGFTALSEETAPEQLFEMISAALSIQVDEIHRYGGYVDKFGGDGLMAIFDGPEMEIQSCLCALSIVEHARGPCQTGIGIHTGRAIIGNIGSPEHLDYSAIGMTVNLAARLCGHAEATSIVVSESVRAAAKKDRRLVFHSGRSVSMKGIKTPLSIYNVSAYRENM